MHGLVTLDYGDGTYAFRLGLDQIEELEEKFETSIFEIVFQLANRQSSSRMIREVLRVGLIGGGMAPVEALAKTRRYTDERPLDESRDTAYAVGLAGLARVHSDDLEKEAAEKKAEAPTEGQNGSTSGVSEALPH